MGAPSTGRSRPAVRGAHFQEWVESYGLECVPIGPDLRKMTGGTVPGKPVLPPKEQLLQLAGSMKLDGARLAAERLASEFG